MPVSTQSVRQLSLRQRQGRAANAIAELFKKNLRVPHIYLEAGWPTLGGKRVDVMAVDEAGSGDIHVVEIELGPLSKKAAMLRAMKTAPAHYMYLASDFPGLMEIAEDVSSLFAKSGIGKIGLISIEEREDSQPIARLISPGERFRMPEERYRGVKRFLFKHQPDFEIRI
ncbi:MAG TPA: hypothetical protein VFE38_07770 [Edaphobacter sp.]|nr:hypothetical protein [Edaphobacter sp.]